MWGLELGSCRPVWSLSGPGARRGKFGIIIILKRIGVWSPPRPAAKVSLIILKRVGV